VLDSHGIVSQKREMKFLRAITQAGLALALMTAAFAVQVGEPAPNFALIDSHGKTQRLSDDKGKFVVLEWHSRDCSFVKRHYQSGNMQRLQKDWTAKGVVWLTVISSAPGTPGFMTPSQVNAYLDEESAAPTAVLMDVSGTLGHLYEARTTPQMFVIDPQQNLIYQGAIDDHAKPEQIDVATAKNYLSRALEEAMSGKSVSVPETQPYGCSVKYK
jgi:hypothetical protein